MCGHGSAARSIYDLRRIDIVNLLDAIEDRGAPVMADRTLAHLRKALSWYAARDENFVAPIVKGMARTKPAERARTRDARRPGNPRPLCGARCASARRGAGLLSGIRAHACS